MVVDTNRLGPGALRANSVLTPQNYQRDHNKGKREGHVYSPGLTMAKGDREGEDCRGERFGHCVGTAERRRCSRLREHEVVVVDENDVITST